MKLYYKPGACSLATHIILREVGADFTLDATDTETARTASGADYTRINPNGYVPALETDEGVLTESPAILQYLADRFPAAQLAPPKGIERVRLQELLNFLSAELHKAYAPFFSGQTMATDVAAKARQRVERRIGALDRKLADGRPYLLGARFGVADAFAFVILSWSSAIGVELGRWPMVAAFVERVGARESVRCARQAEGLVASEVSA